MKIHKLLIAVMICAYGQITNASHDEEFIDPMDMEHYDQNSKSMKFTLKEKKSLELFQGLLQRLLKSADERGLKAIMDINIGLEINKFLKNKNWDSNKLQIILENVAFTENKEDLEKESVELFKGFLQRLLNNADERGLKAIMDIDINMEIDKFLNNEKWNSNKLQIILESVAFPEDKENWLWTLVAGGVILFVLTLLMKIFYWRQPAQNVVINEEEEEEEEDPEDDNEYIEDQISTPTPETGQHEAVQYFRSERRNDPDTEQNEKDKCRSQHLEKSHKFIKTQDVNLDESHEQENYISAEVNRAKTLSSEKQKVVTKPGANELADISDYNQELLSSDTEGSSENQVNVDTVLSTHHSQNNSMTVDEESDFFVLNEDAPESLTFIRDEDCGEIL